MEEALNNWLNPGTLDRYRALAAAHGRSLEAELRAVIEAGLSRPRKDCAALLRLSDDALAMTPPDGPDPSSDSTMLIRWDRDANGGDWIDDGWDDGVSR